MARTTPSPALRPTRICTTSPWVRRSSSAQYLVHRTLEAVHGVHHQVQRRVEEPPGLLRVEVPDQVGRAFEVGKQHRDLLALAFQGVLASTDLIGEVPRDVCEQWALRIMPWRLG
jgi:hypothetical protein